MSIAKNSNNFGRASSPKDYNTKAQQVMLPFSSSGYSLSEEQECYPLDTLYESLADEYTCLSPLAHFNKREGRCYSRNSQSPNDQDFNTEQACDYIRGQTSQNQFPFVRLSFSEISLIGNVQSSQAGFKQTGQVDCNRVVQLESSDQLQPNIQMNETRLKSSFSTNQEMERANSLTFGSQRVQVNSCQTSPSQENKIFQSASFEPQASHLNRMEKSLRFRQKRRIQNLKTIGEQFYRRQNVKNCNRQVAACNRKRDNTGKFLLGPRKQRNRFYQPGYTGQVFKITKVIRKKQSQNEETSSLKTCENSINELPFSFLPDSEFFPITPWAGNETKLFWNDESNYFMNIPDQM